MNMGEKVPELFEVIFLRRLNHRLHRLEMGGVWVRDVFPVGGASSQRMPL